MASGAWLLGMHYEFLGRTRGKGNKKEIDYFCLTSLLGFFCFRLTGCENWSAWTWAFIFRKVYGQVMEWLSELFKIKLTVSPEMETWLFCERKRPLKLKERKRKFCCEFPSESRRSTRCTIPIAKSHPKSSAVEKWVFLQQLQFQYWMGVHTLNLEWMSAWIERERESIAFHCPFHFSGPPGFFRWKKVVKTRVSKNGINPSIPNFHFYYDPIHFFDVWW